LHLEAELNDVGEKTKQRTARVFLTNRSFFIVLPRDWAKGIEVALG